MNISFCFGAIEFQCDFIMRPSKVRKLVPANQFQVKSTKMGTGRKFVTLQQLRGKTKLVKSDLHDPRDKK